MKMDEEDDKDDTKRKSRNLSEKKRRDQFNLLVNELSSMVSSNSRKMDKSTVLKSTIAFLKNHNEVTVRSRAHEIQENWKPSFLSNEEFTHLILEALDGFIMVFSSNGKILYASESITSLLGHLPNDLMNMTIYDMVYEEDQSDIYNILLNPTMIVDPLQNGITPENQITFHCHIKRGVVDPNADITYEFVQFTGYFRNNVEVDIALPSNRFSGYSSDTDTRLIFVGTGRLMTPQLIREMSIVDSTKSEFTSRHSLEWKFLFLDHRAPPIIGYLPFEVLGTSGYDYYHFDDLDKVVLCHEALMQKGEGTSCHYRFLTKGQQWIWLQTRFYITYHQWNSKPEFVVCTHRVVSYADVMRQMRKCNEKDSDEVDSTIEDRKAPTSSSMMATSPWSSKSSRASKSLAQSQGSPTVKGKRYHTYHRPDSDSTSMSADSPHSHHSLLTQHSCMSQKSMSQQNAQSKHSSSGQPIVQYNQQYAHPQFHHPYPYQSSQSSSQQSSHSHHIQQTQILPLHQQAISSIPSPLITHQRQPTAQIIGAPFIEPSQYLTAIPAIPVQPVIAGPSFSGHVITSSPSPPDFIHSTAGVVIAPNQNQLQDHLQRRHEELQKLIVHQQEELRRVSEQLIMTRYGLLPPIVNVSLPFQPGANPSVSEADNRSVNSNPQQQNTYHELQQMQSHSGHQHSQLNIHSQQLQQDSTQNQTWRMGPPSENSMSQQMDGNQSQSAEEMISYMHLSSQTSTSNQQQHNQHLHQQQQPQQTIANIDQQPNQQQQQQQQQQQPQQQQPQQHQIVSSTEMELMPFQMTEEQAQILFTSNSKNN